MYCKCFVRGLNSQLLIMGSRYLNAQWIAWAYKVYRDYHIKITAQQIDGVYLWIQIVMCIYFDSLTGDEE